MQDIYFKDVEKAQIILNAASNENNAKLSQAVLQNTSYLDSIGIQRLQINVSAPVNISRIIEQNKISIALMMHPSVLLDRSGTEFVKNFSSSKYVITIGIKKELGDKHMNPTEKLLLQNSSGVGILFFVELSFERGLMNNVAESIDYWFGKGVKNFILSPVFGIRKTHENNGLFSFSDFSELYYILQEKAKKSESLKLYFRQGVSPKTFLFEHPCNAYVCSDNFCHGSKSGLPRKIFIDSQGDVYPESGRMHPGLSIGNLFNDTLKDLLTDYYHSQKHSRFVSLCQNVFETYIINCPYPVIPLTDLLVKESWEN